VSNAFEKKALQNGIVTTQTLAEMFKEHHEKMLAALQEAGGGLIAAATVNADKNQEPEFAEGGLDEEEPATTTVTATSAVYCTYTHSGRFWHTPPGFALPSRMKLDTGWKIWCLGIPCYQIKNTDNDTARAAPIRPFHASRARCCQSRLKEISICIGGQSLK
jgi:hypothetical protein